VGIVGVLLLASTYLGHQEVISRAVLLMFIPLLALATAVGEVVFRRAMRKLERGHLSLERTLLAGSPSRVQAWLESAHGLARQGVDIAGYLADPAEGGQLPPLGGGEVPWLGERADILAVVRRYRISQVVFWETPAVGAAEAWLLLASLRRLRVRLRWHGSDAWLLATGARAEMFGRELSAVQSAGGGLVLRVLLDRLLALVAAGLLAVVGFLPWLWLRAVRIPRGGARCVVVKTSDLWGHDPELTVACDGHGRVLSLVWQWALAGALWRGKLAVFGPRPGARGKVQVPCDPAGVLAFWRDEPRTPGLAGSWNSESPPNWWTTLAALWRHPGGFDELELESENGEADPPVVERFSGSG